MDAGAIAPGTQAALLLQQRAGQALKNGRPAETLSACDQSAKLYAQVPLAEGCEILAVGALVSLGRTDEANARANAFRAKYPNSTLAPNLDRILSTKSDDR